MKYDKARMLIIGTNGVPFEISEYVRDVQITEAPSDWGLNPISYEFTLTGNWSTSWNIPCPRCGLRFTLEQHVPQPHLEVNGIDIGPCCAACAVELCDES